MNKNKKILVIDDDSCIRDIVRTVLSNNGYAIIEAENGDMGLSIQRENPADLVITDIIMPEKEGLETIRELKSGFPEVKIIAMSGGGHAKPDEYLLIARAMGADFTFKKPFDNAKLVEAVIELIGN